MGVRSTVNRIFKAIGSRYVLTKAPAPRPAAPTVERLEIKDGLRIVTEGDSIASKRVHGAIVNTYSETAPPPTDIPDELREEFTMSGKIPVRYYYSAVQSHFRPRITKEVYECTLAAIAGKTFNYYGGEGAALYDAFEKYTLKDKSVLVFGLTECNCDALAIHYGASSVYVVDYNKPVCEHDKVTVFDLGEWKSSGLKADFGISFSSFEHDGLGQYGDPISANGDLRAMKEAGDALNAGGLLFLGVPMSQDYIAWNMYRSYGDVRLPELLKGWLCLDAFHPYWEGAERPSPDFPFDMPVGTLAQPLLVLKKLGTDYPDMACLDKMIEDVEAETSSNSAQSGTRDPKMLLHILRATKTQMIRAEQI